MQDFGNSAYRPIDSLMGHIVIVCAYTTKETMPTLNSGRDIWIAPIAVITLFYYFGCPQVSTDVLMTMLMVRKSNNGTTMYQRFVHRCVPGIVYSFNSLMFVN